MFTLLNVSHYICVYSIPLISLIHPFLSVSPLFLPLSISTRNLYLAIHSSCTKKIKTYINFTCPLLKSVRCRVVSVVEKCPLSSGIRRWKMSVVEWCPLSSDARCWKVSVVEWCPLLKGVRCRVMSIVEWCPLSSDVRCRVISVVEWCPLSSDVRCWKVFIFNAVVSSKPAAAGRQFLTNNDQRLPYKQLHTPVFTVV